MARKFKISQNDYESFVKHDYADVEIYQFIVQFWNSSCILELTITLIIIKENIKVSYVFI